MGKYKSHVSLTKEGKKVDASRLMAVMSLGVKQGETVKVEVEGEDEADAATGLSAFFKSNL